jgi:phosphoenolpyruvate-protein kinase (PTS system EI component)
MGERVLRGAPASPGTAVGAARVLSPAVEADAGPLPRELHDQEVERAERALEAAAAELDALAAQLRAEGRDSEADIVETGVLMAGDPGLLQDIAASVRERGRTAPAAIIEAAEAHATAIGALDDPLLSERAADVRSLGNRAARLAAGAAVGSPRGQATDAAAVLVAADLGPADVAELGPEVVAIALAEGGVRAHAAIVARSLGLPMVVAAGADVLSVGDGEPLLVDGSEGFVVASPSSSKTERAALAVARRAAARERSTRLRGVPARTVDGHSVRVLANVASAAEVRVALEAGAEGAGLIRTELAFLDAPRWPTEKEHRRSLEPVLGALRGRVATVRVADLGGDKTPPFLAGTEKRGIELLLEAPDALVDQLRAILSFAGSVELRLLLPMVSEPAQVAAVREALERALPDGPLPALGAMVETPEAALGARDIAAAADFLSIGTNDLAHATLGLDRFAPGDAPAHHPRVLGLIEATAAAAHREGVLVEVCGEAASDPLTVPLLVGLGVDELSAGAARVGAVREWVRALTYGSARELVRKCLGARSAFEAAAIARPLARSLESLESGDAAGKSVNGAVRVVTVGPES